jgi:hypothetical protein
VTAPLQTFCFQTTQQDVAQDDLEIAQTAAANTSVILQNLELHIPVDRYDMLQQGTATVPHMDCARA